MVARSVEAVGSLEHSQVLLHLVVYFWRRALDGPDAPLGRVTRARNVGLSGTWRMRVRAPGVRSYEVRLLMRLVATAIRTEAASLPERLLRLSVVAGEVSIYLWVCSV